MMIFRARPALRSLSGTVPFIARLSGMNQEIAHLGLLDEDEIMLDVAALEIAELDHPGIDLDPYLDRLGEIVEDLAARGSLAETAAEQAEVLAEVIAGRHGFTGDRDTYDDPANADLISVIDRRRGMPVALSILYVALARRVGWHADALNTPGHVLVSVGEDDDDPVLIDPFNGGVPVDVGQLAALLSGVLGGRDVRAADHMAPMSNRAVLVRLMMNQASRAEQAREPHRALEIYERITAVAPAYAYGWWEKARLELVDHNVPAARASLGAMLEVTRDPVLRSQAGAALEALAAHGS